MPKQSITSAEKENGTAKSVCGAVWTERATASRLPALGVAQHSKASALCHGLFSGREEGEGFSLENQGGSAGCVREPLTSSWDFHLQRL